MRRVAAACALLTAHACLNARLLPRATACPSGTERVSVLIPARDEAEVLGACLRSVLAQSHPCEVLVLDDASRDDTAQIARGLGVRVLAGSPLPDGWLGKPHACQQLAQAATGDVLLFLDADVVLTEEAVAATLALLHQTGWDLVSPYPRQLAAGRTRLVQPLLQWSWLTFVPLRFAQRPAFAVANGQVLAVRRAAYEACGGHAAVRTEVVEDVALLRAVLRSGGRGGVADGTDLATCRMYGSWAELSAGYRKSLHTVPLPALAVLAGLYLAPAAAALRGSRSGALAVGVGIAGRMLTARRTGSPPLDAVAHPVSVGALIWLALRSRHDRRRGQLVWKGRVLP